MYDILVNHTMLNSFLKVYKIKKGEKKRSTKNLKSAIPVCGPTHFLLLVRAGGRVSVPIVVETVEGVVGVVEHICGSVCDPQCDSPGQSPAATPCPAALLCHHALLRQLTLALSSADDGCLQRGPPLLCPSSSPSQLPVSRLRTTSLSPVSPCISTKNLTFANLDFIFILSPAMHLFFLGYSRWPTVSHLSDLPLLVYFEF